MGATEEVGEGVAESLSNKKTPHSAGLSVGPRFFFVIALSRGKKRNRYVVRLRLNRKAARPMLKSARVPGSGTALITEIWESLEKVTR